MQWQLLQLQYSNGSPTMQMAFGANKIRYELYLIKPQYGEQNKYEKINKGRCKKSGKLIAQFVKYLAGKTIPDWHIS